MTGGGKPEIGPGCPVLWLLPSRGRCRQPQPPPPPFPLLEGRMWAEMVWGYLFVLSLDGGFNAKVSLL